MTASHVEIYGLRIAAPVALPGRVVRDASVPADVTLHLRENPPAAVGWGDRAERTLYRSATLLHGEPSLLADRPGDEGWIRLRYAEGIAFHLSPRGEEVWADWRSPLTEADAVAFFLGPVLGAVLRRRGVAALHASAVVLAGKAYLFLGSRGSGKSTLAAAFGRAGYPVLSEDVAALRLNAGVWTVDPAYTDVRLWDEGAELVDEDAAALPALTPTWPKRRLDLVTRGWALAAERAPLHGVFILEDFAGPGVGVRAREISARDCLVELVANSYVNYLAESAELARELALFGQVAPVLRSWSLRPAHGREGVRRTVEEVVRLVESSAADAGES